MMRPFLAVIVLLALLAGLPIGRTPSAGSGPLLEYNRSGGIAGLNDHLVIEPSGKATLTRKTASGEVTLDQATLNQLQAAADKADFPKLQGEHLPARPGADLFEYVVVYKGQRVRTMDTAVPEAPQPLLAIPNRIVESGGVPA